MKTGFSKWLSAAVLAVSFSQIALPAPSADAAADLYPFTSFTFTSVGKVGRAGPDLSRLLTNYDSATNSWLTNTSYFTTTIVSPSSGIQLWTVPKTGTYQITAAGAQGGPYTSTSGGLGAIMTGTFSLTQGDKYKILVGQISTIDSSRTGLSSSGGGGSFVVKNSGDTVANILVIAGGGGGTSSAARNTNANAIADSSTAGTSSDGNAGGSNGQGGVSGISNSGGGGGFLSPSNSFSAPGQGFAYGGLGGTILDLYAPDGGGFGGGGASAGGSLARYSGGGGYNGGGSTSTMPINALSGNYGGGGSSFNRGTNQNNTVGNLGSGYVTIELIIPQSSITISSPSTGTYGITLTITANVSMEGKVTFYAREKRIPGCINVQTSSLVATCQYKVGTRNSVGISATLRPTDSTYTSSTTPTKYLAISNRATKR